MKLESAESKIAVGYLQQRLYALQDLSQEKADVLARILYYGVKDASEEDKQKLYVFFQELELKLDEERKRV